MERRLPFRAVLGRHEARRSGGVLLEHHHERVEAHARRPRLGCTQRREDARWMITRVRGLLAQAARSSAIACVERVEAVGCGDEIFVHLTRERVVDALHILANVHTATCEALPRGAQCRVLLMRLMPTIVEQDVDVPFWAE
eukprot:scaffold108749_cov105-Phaeocystis_antarctica.AAC.1